MSIMDFFRTTSENTQGNVQQNQQKQNEPQGSSNTLSGNPPTTNADGKMPGTNEATTNPLDAYKKMFDDAAKNSDIQAPTFKLDDKVLSDVSSKMDFAKNIDPALMTKALSGDASALMQVMQATNQNAYKAALEHSSALTDTFIGQRSAYEKQQLNAGVKTQLTHQALADTPNYDHPVIKAELNAKAEQFARANPDMPPQEIAKAAQKYITDLYSAMNPAKAAPKAGEPGSTEMDWSKYLTS